MEKIKRILVSILIISIMLGMVTPNKKVMAVTTSGDYTYNTNSDGTISITKYNGAGSSVNIPTVIDNKSVTSIGSSAFSGGSSLASVTIPESVTSIGSYAFYNCNSLTEIMIPKSVTSMGD
ncbi:leucine-rich repeat protein, partial [Clostridium akagii]|uniref:leucine-rich repeat protein n=1 Tax=Clostridium akagii TaxID=91623 RepID=UPI00055FA11E